MPDIGNSGGVPFVPHKDMYSNRLASAEAVKLWRFERRAETVVAALKRNGYEALLVPDRAAARSEVLTRVPAGATIGVGGSLTIRALDVLEELKRAGHTVYDHWTPGLSEEEVLAVRRAQLSSDVFLSSVNAATLKGQLVSTDGIGNRIAAMTFGPRKVILVIGANKVVDDLDAALKRTRQVCAPLALRESGAPLPCAQNGICGDCQSEGRLCRATLILDCRPLLTDTTVLMVAEELGF